MDEEIKKLKEEYLAKEEVFNELNYQIRDLDHKIENLDQSIDHEKFDGIVSKSAKQKTGVGSVLQKFFKKSAFNGVKNENSTSNMNQLDSGICENKLIRPVKFQEIEFICKELIIMLINQEVSIEKATKIFETKVDQNGLLISESISECLKVFHKKLAVYAFERGSHSDGSVLCRRRKF